jgi:hypothetical protein
VLHEFTAGQLVREKSDVRLTLPMSIVCVIPGVEEEVWCRWWKPGKGRQDQKFLASQLKHIKPQKPCRTVNEDVE